ncbi:Hypothetical protein AA314_08237 [Archangium gephyra]|uniref:Uncharacterized protein n=1 Tax=Archangium gephyra TaxID=48 RepID=A0AAC8QFQ2_9BACT|nr:Hypothetical protein AA314_08237 [Archangium gephyra]
MPTVAQMTRAAPWARGWFLWGCAVLTPTLVSVNGVVARS